MHPLHLAWEWWLQLWPNMFAISVWTTLLLIWHHITLKRHVDRKHAELHDKLDRQHAEHLAAVGTRHRKDVSPT